MTYSEAHLIRLLNELRALPKETEWAEFKGSNAEPEEIGEYISALANSAALAGKTAGYLVWGVEASTHDVVGSEFNLRHRKVGNEELENWLLRLLSPKINFYFHELNVEQKKIVILEIERATKHPVQFKGREFVRVGSYKKLLKDFPEKERQLWRIFDTTPFEDLHAAENMETDDVLKCLDYPAYFELLGLSLPDNKKGILERLMLMA